MRHQIPASVIEFDEGGNTIWIQGAHGATTLRIKTLGKIEIEHCETSPVSHCDIIVKENIHFCLSDDSNNI